MDDGDTGNNAAVMLERWVREQLAGAGFSDYDVCVAIDESLDWRTMVQLRERGCPAELALAIVK